MKYYSSIFVLFILSLNLSFSQKYGYVNLGNVVASLPQTKAADTQIKTFTNQLVKQGEGMAQKLQSDYQAAIEKVQRGDISPIQQQELERALQTQQGEIARFEQEIQKKVAQKREELLAPILDKVKNVIESIGKEEGYIMIFDSSVFNAVLYGGEQEDLTKKVLAALGVN